MARISSDLVDKLAQYTSCEKCGASLSSLQVGGVGDWFNSIQCLECFHVRDHLDFERVIVPLVARKADKPEKLVRAWLIDKNKAYLAHVARMSDFR